MNWRRRWGWPASRRARCRSCARTSTSASDEFLNRPLTGEWPYVWLDATYLKVRQGGRIVSVAAIIAVAANTDGRSEIIGLGIGPSEAETFWMDFLRGLKARGLDGTKLVISDAAQRPQGGHRTRVRSNLAALPRSLDAQRPGACLARPAHRRCRHDPAGLRPARL